MLGGWQRVRRGAGWRTLRLIERQLRPQLIVTLLAVEAVVITACRHVSTEDVNAGSHRWTSYTQLSFLRGACLAALAPVRPIPCRAGYPGTRWKRARTAVPSQNFGLVHNRIYGTLCH